MEMNKNRLENLFKRETGDGYEVTMGNVVRCDKCMVIILLV